MPDDYGQYMAGWARGSPIPWETSNQLMDILKLRGAMPQGMWHRAQELNQQQLMGNLGALNAMMARRGGAGSGMHTATAAGLQQGSSQNLLDLWRQWQERQQNQWRQDISGLGFPFMQMQLGNLGQSLNAWQQQQQIDLAKKQQKQQGLGGMLGGLGGLLGGIGSLAMFMNPATAPLAAAGGIASSIPGATGPTGLFTQPTNPAWTPAPWNPFGPQGR